MYENSLKNLNINLGKNLTWFSLINNNSTNQAPPYTNKLKIYIKLKH